MLQVCRGGYKATAQSPHLLLGQPFQKGGNRIDGRRKDRGEIILRLDIDECLDIAELQCDETDRSHQLHRRGLGRLPIRLQCE